MVYPKCQNQILIIEIKECRLCVWEIFWGLFEPSSGRTNHCILSKKRVWFFVNFWNFSKFSSFQGGGHQVVAQHLGPAQIAIVFAFDPFMDRFQCFGLLLESVFPCKTPKNTQKHLPPKRTGECINNTFITSSGLKRWVFWPQKFQSPHLRVSGIQIQLSSQLIPKFWKYV